MDGTTTATTIDERTALRAYRRETKDKVGASPLGVYRSENTKNKLRAPERCDLKAWQSHAPSHLKTF